MARVAIGEVETNLGVRPHVVEAFEQALAEAKAGKLRACVIVTYRTDGDISAELSALTAGEYFTLSAGLTRAQHAVQLQLDAVEDA